MGVNRFRVGMHDLDQDVALNDGLGRNPFTAGTHHVDHGGLFVCGEIGFQEETLDLDYVTILEYPVTSRESRLANHVLTAGIAGCKVKTQVSKLVRQVIVDVLEPDERIRSLADSF